FKRGHRLTILGQGRRAGEKANVKAKDAAGTTRLFLLSRLRPWFFAATSLRIEQEDARPSLNCRMWVCPSPHKKQGSHPMIDIFAEIATLKQRENATILAHYYQDGEIQELADFTGDSLKLARAATRVQTETIVFCGVHFMAETAKMLNPG